MSWTCPWRKRRKPEVKRIVQLKRTKQKFCSNEVRTSKYTLYTFLPKNLWAQFQKLSNVYFLIIVIIQATPVSTTNGIPVTALPLFLVLFANGAKDAYEDYQRHKSDELENGQCTFVVKKPIEKFRRDSKFLKGGMQSDVPIELSWIPDPTPSPRFEDVEIGWEGSMFSESLKPRRWRDLGVGDIVYVTDKELLPADIVLLATSDENGIAFVETSSLDGETNLKIRKVSPGAMKVFSPPSPDAIFDVFEVSRTAQGCVECDPPNASINTFEGVICLSTGAKDAETEKDSLSALQACLRGCRLRNTAWILGLVIYTGRETKIQMNSGDPPHKVSRVEKMTNWLTLVVLLLQILVCLCGAIGTGVLASMQKFIDLSYLDLNTDSSPAYLGFTTFFTWITLFTNFIPISLIVTMGIVKAIQTVFIAGDDTMYYQPTKTFAAARTSDLNEELGQVKYLFSDKTGTLTSNVMQFRKCCISGVSYGTGITQVRRRVLEAEMGISVPPDPRPPPGAPITPHVNFVDSRLDKDLENIMDPHYMNIMDFFIHLAVNHAVVTEKIERKPTFVDRLPRIRTQDEFPSFVSIGSLPPGKMVSYSASSPDEGALVYAAKHFGITFVSRNTNGLSVDIRGNLVTVEVVAAFEFTSTRKRSSVLCSFVMPGTEQRRFLLFTKGADTILLPRLSSVGDKENEILAVMDQYAADGLRTLCLAKRELSPSEVETWAEEYRDATLDMTNREEKVEAMAEKLEIDLELQGVTGIEDKLQDGVHSSIELLMKAGIQVWMLTGDKMETAINIGVATNLITTGMARLLFQWDTMVAEMKGKYDPTETPPELEELVKEKPQHRDQLLAVWARIHVEIEHVKKTEAAADAQMREKDERVLVVDGDTLTALLFPAFQNSFIQMCRLCRTVICCRVSPQQKGAVVSLIRRSEKAVTLAIGDGANDCNMIQNAHVGIGIRGVEGLQAFNTSDYGISQFRFLTTLLLVHGRWNYRRNCKLVTYMFYKNIVLVLPIFYFTWTSFFSGQRIYSELIYQIYNVFLTSLPIMVFGVLDQDVDRAHSLKHPHLYKLGIKNAYFNKRIFWESIISAIWHSIPIYVLPVAGLAYTQITATDAVPNDLWIVGQVIFLQVMIVVNMKVLLDTYYLTWITWFVIVLSLLGWFVFMFIVSVTTFFASETSGVLPRTMSMPIFYPLCVIVPIVALSRDLVWKVLRSTFFPREYHKIFADMLSPKEENVDIAEEPSYVERDPRTVVSTPGTSPEESQLCEGPTRHHPCSNLASKSFSPDSGGHSRLSVTVDSARLRAVSLDTLGTRTRYGSVNPTSSVRGYAFTAPDRGTLDLATAWANSNPISSEVYSGTVSPFELQSFGISDTDRPQSGPVDSL